MGDDHLYGDEHVERYRATDGQEGYYWRRGSEILLLSTRGRKSGEQGCHTGYVAVVFASLVGIACDHILDGLRIYGRVTCQ